MEAVIELQNVVKAFNQVKRNKGAAGVDGMTVDELDAEITRLGQHMPHNANKSIFFSFWNFGVMRVASSSL